MKKIVSLVIRVGISGAVIFFLFHALRHEWETAFSAMINISKTILIQAVLLYFLTLIFMSLRLYYLLQGQKIYLSKRECLRLTLIGGFFNNFFPTGAGGDVMKVYLVAKKTQQTARSIVSILMDRVIGLAVLVFLASLSGLMITGGPIFVPAPVLKLSYFLLFVNACVIALFSIPYLYSGFSKLVMTIPIRKIKPCLVKVFEAIDQYGQHKPILFKALLVSFLTQLTFAFIIHILSTGLGITLPVFHLLVVLPLIHIVTLIPSINGLGIREGTLVYLLGQTMGAEKALALALLSTAILIFWSLFVGGIFYIVFLLKGGKNDSKGTTRNLGLSHL
jgi:uncharacterized protein (TIRG00374 family)